MDFGVKWRNLFRSLKVLNIFSNNENDKHHKEIKYIQQIMKWNIPKLYDILESEFQTRENFKFPKLDTFYRQMSKKGKGSREKFKFYVNYLYDREDVKEELLRAKMPIGMKILIVVIIIYSVLIILFFLYDPSNLKYSRNQTLLECYQQCREQDPNYREDVDKNINFLDFTILRKVDHIFKSN